MKIGIIGIATGICVMLLTVSIVLGFKREIVSKITGLTAHASISNVNLNSSNEPDPITIHPDTIQRMKEMKFISKIQGTAFKNGLLKTDEENEGILLKGVAQDYDFGYIKKHLVEGETLRMNAEETSRDIMISKALSDKLGLSLGEKILVYFISQQHVYDSIAGEEIIRSHQRSRKLTISGIFKTDFSDFDEQLSIVDLRLIQTINFWDSSQVGNYEVKVRDFEKIDDNVLDLQEMLGYDFNVRSVKESYFNIFIWLDKLDINGVIIIALMILVATINMITALLILILERANMVGLIKAVGMSNSSVRRIFMHISVRLIGKGMLWGNIIGVALCYLQYYFKIVSLDSDTYYVDYVAIEINWLYFLLLNALTFFVCGLMLFLPTLILTRMTPVKTLKFD